MTDSRAATSDDTTRVTDEDGHTEHPVVPGTTMAEPSNPEAALVPDWLVSSAQLGWRVLAIAVLLVVLGYITILLGTVAASIVVAIVVAAVFAPMVLRLRAGGHSRNGAAAIVWTTIILVAIGLLLLLAVAFLPYLGDFVSTLDSSVSDVQTQLAEVNAPDWIGTLLQDAVAQAKDSASQSFASWAGNVVGILILATFLIFFFLRDGDKAWLWIFQASSDEKREVITEAGDEALARVGGYLRGTTVLSGIVALTDLLFMVLLGVPMAGPLAGLVFLGGYIPYFGGIVTSIIVLIVTYSALGAQATLVMILLMGVRGVLVSYLVRPAIYGHTVRIHPALVLVVLPAGWEVAGVVGLFAAVPVTAVLMATARATVAIIRPAHPPSLPDLVPPWIDRVAQFSWRILISIALVALIVGVLNALPLMVVPVILATIFTAALDPLVEALMRRGRSRARAAIIVVAGGFLAIVGLLALAFASLFKQADEIAATANAGADDVDTASGGQLGSLTDVLESGSGQALQTIEGMSGALPAIITVTVLSTLLTYYFLRDGGELWQHILSHAGPDARSSINGAATRAFDVLGGYMIGTAGISFVGAASMFVIMVILGLPLALPVFVLSFILGFIPYIGSLISTLIAFLIAVAVGSTTDVVIMGIWTLVFNIVQGNVVSPMVYGRTVHIHPAIVLVAIPAGSAIAGILGMFIVVPALGVVAATWRTATALLGRSKQAKDKEPDDEADGPPAPASSVAAEGPP